MVWCECKARLDLASILQHSARGGGGCYWLQLRVPLSGLAVAQVGGLGDVVTGLAKASLARGHNVEVGASQLAKRVGFYPF